MIEINKRIVLNSRDGSERLVLNSRYLVQENYTFDLEVVSKSINHSSHFCVRKDEINEFLDSLILITQKKRKAAQLIDNDSDAYILISINKNDEFEVKSQIGGSHEHNVFIRFASSHKSIQLIIKELNSLLSL